MSKLINALCEEFGVPDGTAVPGMNSIEAVNSKIERAEKTEEVDTVTFGLETDDGRIIKVYVKVDEAEDFEQALSKELGNEDVIEDVLNKLSKDFDIIDVEWPDQQNSDDQESDEDDELSVDNVDMDGNEKEKDGSDSLNKKVWGAKSGREKTKHLVKKESDMSYGQLFTKKILGEQDLEEGKRFVTVIGGKEKVFGAFDEKAAQKLADRWGGDKVKPYVGHQKGGAKKKVAEGRSSIDDIVEQFGARAIIQWLENGDNDKLEDVLMDYYIDKMPYGTAKARDGDPYNWIADRFPEDLVDAGYIDAKTYKWIANEDLNEFKYETPADKEATTVKQPGGRRYKVGMLDSRFTTVYQFMIYQALLDLGVPDEALNKAAQKSAIVTSIKNTAAELQKDPVRRQALRFLINRLKETTDVNEAKKVEETPDDADTNDDGKVTAREKKEAEALKVGLLDDRFVTLIQKMVYQTILMLGLPDAFIAKSAYKNTIINSIKAKAKEIQKDSVKRSALRIFTHRFAEVNEALELVENAGSQAVEFVEFFIDSFVPESKKAIADNLKSSTVWQATKRAIVSNGDAAGILQSVRAQLGNVSSKMAAKGSATPFKEQLDMVNETETDVKVQDYISDIEHMKQSLSFDIKNQKNPKIKELLVNAMNSMDKSVELFKQKKPYRAFYNAMLANSFLRKAAKLNSLSEAKWGDEPLLDDPDDKETDPDTKVKAKLPKRKKDKRTGEEVEWEINKVKKTGELTLETEGLTITLDDESAEKLIKAISSKSIAVLPDSELSGTKWVFSPRARTYMVKQANSGTVKPLILTWDDTNNIEDVYLGK